jgi:hypothetical protein
MIPETTRYEIRIRDVLGEKWATCFAPFMLTAGTEETLLIGVAHDQAELFGVLLKIRDLGLRLVSVTPANADEEAEAVEKGMAAETTQEINFT